MSLLFAHSTDGQDTTAASGLFNPNSQFPTGYGTTDPRFPGTGYVTGGAFNTEGLQFTCKPADEDDLFIIGTAYWIDGATDAGSAAGIIGFFSDAGVTSHVRICITADGAVRVRRGDGAGTILGTSSTGVVPFNTWFYIAAKVRLHDSTGTVDIEINGSNVLSLTGLDTKNGGTKTVFDTAGWGAPGGGLSPRRRDLYVCNEAGTKNNDFLGDVRVTASFPTGDTTPEQWTPSTGSDSFAVVDEASPNTTDYLESSTVGHITRMTLADLPDTTHEVLGVVVKSYAAKSDAGAVREFRNGMFSDATTEVGATNVLGTGFTTFLDVFELDPDGDVDWTPTSYNASAVQVEVVS